MIEPEGRLVALDGEIDFSLLRPGVRDEELRRYVLTAKLFPDGAGVLALAGLPELYDVRMVAMSQQAFTLSGLEREGGADYAQSWLVALP